MIISPSRKFLFIHLHKCGGTSVERAYEKNSIWDDLILGSTRLGAQIAPHYNKQFGLHKHITAGGIINAIGLDRYLELESFALVRNPFRLYESLYAWSERNLSEFASANSISNEVMKAQLREGNIRRPFANWPAYQAYANSNDFAGFMAHLINRKSKLINSFESSLLLDDPIQSVKSVYRLEDMEDFWSAFEKKTGVEIERLHANKTVGSTYDWDSSHVDYVSEVHRRDLTRFGYSF